MARLKSLDQITGNLKNLSFYTRKGSDAIIVRTKGGASREKIKRDPAFAAVRNNNKEFGGCSRMGKQIRLAFYGLEHVADHNLSSELNALAKTLQKTDEARAVGERSICLSKYRSLLAGYEFSRTTRFASVLRVPLTWNIVRERQQATVDIPAFACSFGLNGRAASGRATYGLFRITAALGIVTDLQLNASRTGYEPVHDKTGQGFRTVSTGWYSTLGNVPAQQLALDIADPNAQFDESDSLVLTVALEYGTPDAFGNPSPVRGAGTGMILGVM